MDEAVKALQTHLTQRGTDIVGIEEELEYTKIAITKLTESVATLEREIIRIKRGVKRTQFNIRHIEKYGGKLEREAASYKGRMDMYRNERNNIRKNHQRIHAEIAALRLKTDVAHIQELEVQREKIGEELNTLRQRLGSAQTEISTHQSQFDRVLRIGYKNTKIQLSKVDQTQNKLEKEVADAIAEREAIKKEADELEKSRVDLSKAVFSAREESKKFTSQIDSIDSELRLLDSEYEQAERLLNQLQLSIETSQLRLQQLQGQLRLYGYEQALETNPRQVQEAADPGEVCGGQAGVPLGRHQHGALAQCQGGEPLGDLRLRSEIPGDVVVGPQDEPVPLRRPFRRRQLPPALTWGLGPFRRDRDGEWGQPERRREFADCGRAPGGVPADLGRAGRVDEGQEVQDRLCCDDRQRHEAVSLHRRRHLAAHPPVGRPGLGQCWGDRVHDAVDVEQPQWREGVRAGHRATLSGAAANCRTRVLRLRSCPLPSSTE